MHYRRISGFSSLALALPVCLVAIFLHCFCRVYMLLPVVVVMKLWNKRCCYNIKLVFNWIEFYFVRGCLVDRYPLRDWIQFHWWTALVAVYGACLFVFFSPCIYLFILCIFSFFLGAYMSNLFVHCFIYYFFDLLIHFLFFFTFYYLLCVFD